MNSIKVDIGQKVKDVFESRKMKLTDFAEQLGTVRQNVYRIFKKTDLDTGLLTRISEVLDHNFFQYYVQTNESTTYSKEAIEELIVDNAEYKKELDLAKKEIDHLRATIELLKTTTAISQLK